MIRKPDLRSDNCLVMSMMIHKVELPDLLQSGPMRIGHCGWSRGVPSVQKPAHRTSSQPTVAALERGHLLIVLGFAVGQLRQHLQTVVPFGAIGWFAPESWHQ